MLPVRALAVAVGLVAFGFGGTRTFEGWGKDTKWNTSLFHLTAASVVLFLCDSVVERTIAF